MALSAEKPVFIGQIVGHEVHLVRPWLLSRIFPTDLSGQLIASEKGTLLRARVGLTTLRSRIYFGVIVLGLGSVFVISRGALGLLFATIILLIGMMWEKRRDIAYFNTALHQVAEFIEVTDEFDDGTSTGDKGSIPSD
jgi:hypothetical protein